MARPRVTILDRGEIEAIDRASRALLAESGVDVHSAAARRELADLGAIVTPDRARVLIPEAVVDEALRRAPHEVLLASRDGKHDLRLPDGRPHVATEGAGVTVRDLETDERRPSRSQDLADLTRVADALDVVEVVWPMCVAGDVPQTVHGLAEMALCLENTTKNVQHEAVSAADAEAIIDMAAAVVGGRNELRRRPIFSAIQCPVSPMTLEAGATDGMRALSRAGIPVAPMTMVLLGGSSPVDLASALVVGNAENLASIAVIQAAAPGAPVLWSSSSGPIDMRTGAFCIGAPEVALVNAAGVELSRHYGLPCVIGDLSTDADGPGYQAGLEKIGSSFLALAAGGDVNAGIGGLETSGVMGLEQLVLDSDLVGYALREVEGFRVDADTMSLDLLEKVGPSGNYLKERQTLARFRRALWSPGLLVRDGYAPDASTERRLRERARSRARALLKEHVVPPLPEDVRERIWSHVRAPA